MNMMLHELKVYKRFIINWTLALVALVVFLLSLFPSISQEAEEFKKIMEGFPKALRLALGLSVENIGSLLGFYSYIFLYISLFGAIQAMILGTSILSKEVYGKTADFLLTKPITRAKAMTSKILASFIILAITNIFYIIAATFMAFAVEKKEFSIKTFLLISFTLFFLQLIYMALGIIVSVLIPRIKSVLSISLGTVFTFFIIGTLVSTTEDSALRYITPFKYFDLTYIMKHSSYEYSFIIVAIIFISVAIGASYFIYSKKDIHVI